MNYLYTAVGIMVWVGVVTFSSQALIAHENGKQLAKAREYVQESMQSVSNVVQDSNQTFNNPTQEVVTSPQTNKTITPSSIPLPKKEVQGRDREEDDEEDD